VRCGIMLNLWCMMIMKKNKNGIRDSHYEPKVFPRGLLWGTATSSYQVEGGNYNADWAEFEKTAGNIEDSSVCGLGVDHYNRYKEDFAIAKNQLHNNSHRLSVEWSRLEPNEGEWNEDEFLHYKDVLKELKSNGMTVMLTIHHFTNPLWLSKDGGFEKRRVVRRFSRFVEKVVSELGEWVDLWVTINEPMVYVYQGYILKEWPPKKSSKWGAYRTMMNMARAHKKAYKIIHRVSRKNGWACEVGIANNVSSFNVYRKHSFVDHFLAAVLDRVSNHLFYFLTGKKTHDFLGLNYYFHFRIKSTQRYVASLLGRPLDETVDANFESSDVGWELFPHGIFDVCVDMAEYKKPIYITENGLSTDNDDQRIRSIVGYLLQLYYAIEDGADIRGYFHWSLLDNFEWAKGFEPKFGLIGVDRETMKRMPRPSSEIYGLIAHGNAIEHDFLRFLGHGTHDILEEWKRKQK